MGFSEDKIRKVFDKTRGYCYHCEKKISLKNYGNINGKGAWEIDHSVPKSKGGTNHLNNLLPSCIECNREKGALSTSQYRKNFEEESDDSIIELIAGLAILGLFFGFVSKIIKSSK